MDERLFIILLFEINISMSDLELNSLQIRDGKNPGFLEKTHWGGFNWFNTGLIGFNGQNG